VQVRLRVERLAVGDEEIVQHRAEGVPSQHQAARRQQAKMEKNTVQNKNAK
jgi:hypothetical protein